jgi:hypothetical protein
MNGEPSKLSIESELIGLGEALPCLTGSHASDLGRTSTSMGELFAPVVPPLGEPAVSRGGFSDSHHGARGGKVPPLSPHWGKD